jgi:hypothetical protein
MDGRDKPGHDEEFSSHLSPAQKRQPFEQVHVLLVLEERAVVRRRGV